MKKQYLVALTLSALILSCKKETLSSDVSACGVKDPVKNLSWLKEMIEDEENRPNQLTIRKFEYKGQTYFDWSLLVMSCMACRVYDCDGNVLSFGEVYDENEYSDFVEASRGATSKIIWRGKDAF